MPLRKEVLALKDRYIARYKALNPDTPLLPEEPVVIAGEFVGKNIQKKGKISTSACPFTLFFEL